jgi:hypothetical protein
LSSVKTGCVMSAQPATDLLCSPRRFDLAVEWLVPRMPSYRLFSEEEQDLGIEYLSAVPGLPWPFNRAAMGTGVPR